MRVLFAVRVAAGGLVLALGASIALAQTKGTDSEASFNAGLTHLRQNRPALALEQFKKAIREDPKNAYAYKGLGLTYLALVRQGESVAQPGKLSDAVAAFRKALELNPYYVDVRNDLGTVLILSGDRAGGKKEFLPPFGDPTNPTPEISARNLGQAYLEDKNYPEAINWFRTSLSRNKSYTDAYLGLAEGLLATGRQDEAVTQLEAGVKESPGDPSLQLALGQTYFKVGRFTEARARLEEAVKKDPDGAAGRRAANVLKELPR